MASIDTICECMVKTFEDIEGFSGLPALIHAYANTAKVESETIKTDPAIFKVWPEFVVAGDLLSNFNVPHTSLNAHLMSEAIDIIRDGKRLIEWVAFARVPMPKTTKEFFDRCRKYNLSLEDRGI